MNMEKKIFIRFLFAALLITAGCRKDDTPAEEKTPVGFRAMSQVVSVKGDDDNQGRKSLSEYDIRTFGVWGIARNNLNVQYLWNQPATNNAVQLVPVTAEKVNGEEIYVPAEDAYWFSSSTHDFLALASKEPGTTNTFGTTGLSITHTNATTGAQTDPVMTFTYDMSSKYNPGTGKTPDYTYDLLGAAAQNNVEKVIPATQDLVFWHLFSQININVNFVDNAGQSVSGATVSEIRLKEVDTKASCSFGLNSQSLLTADWSIATPASETTIILSGSANTVHIIPQNITDFEMYMDFTVGGVTYHDFKINLDIKTTDNPNGKNPSEYTYNGRYDWNIRIGPKEDISFKVEVTPWDSTTVKDSNNKDEFDII